MFMLRKMIPGALTHRQVSLPSSKSYSHRAILCAALANGTSHLNHIAYSDDIRRTLDAMKVLGVQIEEDETGVTIHGGIDFSKVKECTVDCHESGSTLRFLIPLFSLADCPVHFTGTPRLLARPQTVYQTLFESQGLKFEQKERELVIEGKLQAGDITVCGNVSSQFISGLCMMLPLCLQDSLLHIVPPFESRPYVDLTLDMQRQFGVEIEQRDEFTYFIRGNQHYRPHSCTIESDFSQFAFFAILGALQGPLDCVGLNPKSLQGDKAVVDILRSCSVQINEIENGYRIEKSEGKATTIDLKDCPDLGPALMTYAAFCQGETHFVHCGRLRMKESDRIAAIEEELRKCGVQISSNEEEVWVQGGKPWYGNVTLQGHNDHRIVMALAVASTIAENPICIKGSEAIRKSYPNFFKDLESCGIHVE